MGVARPDPQDEPSAAQLVEVPGRHAGEPGLACVGIRNVRSDPDLRSGVDYRCGRNECAPTGLDGIHRSDTSGFAFVSDGHDGVQRVLESKQQSKTHRVIVVLGPNPSTLQSRPIYDDERSTMRGPGRWRPMTW